MPRRLSEEEAVSRLRSFGFEPRADYPGAGNPWPSVHRVCGESASPSLSNLSAGSGGCTPCALLARTERARSHGVEGAVEELRSYGYEPKAAFPGQSKRWQAVHLKCGEERRPVLAALRDGKGACGPCAAARAAAAKRERNAKDAVKELAAAGLSPLDDYPGVDERWRVRRGVCGHEGETTLTMVRAGSIGCVPCANAGRGRRGDVDQAVADMRAAGLEPLDEYPGTAKPWRSRHTCGAEVSPALGNVRAGHNGCEPCARQQAGLARRVPNDVAYAEMVAAGHLPTEPYPGLADEPWPCVHVACGRDSHPTLSRIREGERCCGMCGIDAAARARRRDPVEAAAVMIAAGFKPLVDYPGAKAPWRSTHLACGREASPTLGSIEAGIGGCRRCGWESAAAAQTLDSDDALKQLRSFGFEPLADYPGASVPWRAIHVACGQERSPRLSVLRAGATGGCTGCATRRRVEVERAVHEARARAKVTALGYVPVEAYVNALTPWLVRHRECGAVSPVRAAELHLDAVPCHRCRARGFGFAAPALVYMVTDGWAHKIGIAGVGTDRVRRHRRQGWEVFKTQRFATGAQARAVEQWVLRRLRGELGLPAYYTRELMPQGGASETVDANEITLPGMWRLVVAAADVVEAVFTEHADEPVELGGGLARRYDTPTPSLSAPLVQ